MIRTLFHRFGKTYISYILPFLTVVMISCNEKTDPIQDSNFNSPDEIYDNPNVIQAVEKAIITTYEGDNPPNIEGEYFTNGVTFYRASQNYSFLVGNNANSEFKLYDQTSDNRIYHSELVANGDYGDGSGAFVTGYDNYFTIWLEQNNSDGSTTILIITGEKLENLNLDVHGVTIITKNPPTNGEVGDWWAYYGTLYNKSDILNKSLSYKYFYDQRDGKSYPTIQIGSQVWMAENLAYASSGSLLKDDDSPYSEFHGRFYDFDEACSVCPDGWHLPSDEEWKLMEIAMGMSSSEADETWYRGEDIFVKFKSQAEWYFLPGTNESGFSALPAGDGDSSIGYSASFWTSTKNDGGRSFFRGFMYSTRGINRDDASSDNYFSVRCVKD